LDGCISQFKRTHGCFVVGFCIQLQSNSGMTAKPARCQVQNGLIQQILEGKLKEDPIIGLGEKMDT